MGRKRTFVGTQIARVIDDDKTPNSVKKGLIDALFSDGEIVDHVLEQMLSNIGVKAERLYDFAKNGHYVHGLPSGRFTNPGDQVMAAVKAVVDVIHGSPVEMHYAHFGPPNSFHIGWMKLVASHGYNPVTNELTHLSATNGRPVYLDDMVLVIPPSLLDSTELQSVQHWGLAPNSGYTPERVVTTPEFRSLIQPSQIEVPITAATEHLRVEYIWKTLGLDIIKDSFQVEITGYDDDADYFQASYTVGGQVYYFMYRSGLGTHPTLDELVDSDDNTNGEFFPFLYFRHGKVSEIADKSTESYRDGVKLAKYLGITYDQIAEGVDANPDIADIEQAMIMFAVPANTENEHERAYLFDFFTNLFEAQGEHLRFQREAQADIVSTQLFGASVQPPGIVIQDARFKMSLSNLGVYKILKAGTVAAVGKHTSGMSSFNVSTKYIEYTESGDTEQTLVTPVTFHYYRRQITESVYEEIQVVELQTRFHINGSYSTTGDEDDKILLIPLDHSITENYSIATREVLYARSLHYVFNSLTTIKLKWYQTGLFQVIMIVVAVVITYFTWGADGGAAISAALAAGTYATLQLIFTWILKYILVQLVFKLFVKAVGVEAAFVIAVIAALVGVGIGLESGGLAGSPWAQNLLSLSTGISKAVGAQIQADILNLSNDLTEFQKFTEEQFKLIEAAQDLLEQNHYLSPFVIFGEKPDDFYNRTVHSGNIGVVGIEAISSFVDSKLNLPGIQETLGKGMPGEEYVW